MTTIDPNQLLAQPATLDSSAVRRQEDGNAMGRDAFMKLLVAQLEHQDPLDPMDPRESITQLAELQGIEEMRAMEWRLANLEVGLAGLSNTQAADLVGKTVTAETGALRLDELGTATGAVHLGGPAERLVVKIHDASGQHVATVTRADLPAGSTTITWDGTSATGERLPPGRYTMEVDATSADGGNVAVTTEHTGRVTGVTYANGFPELLLGNIRVVLGDVETIAE